MPTSCHSRLAGLYGSRLADKSTGRPVSKSLHGLSLQAICVIICFDQILAGFMGLCNLQRGLLP